MTETMTALVLLLLIEDVIFTFLLKNKGFLSFTYEKSKVFQYAFASLIITATPFALYRMLSDDTGVLMPAVISVVLAAGCTLYYLYIKKDRAWYFLPSLAINSVSAILLCSHSDMALLSDNVYFIPAATGVAAALAVLCYAGLKDNLTRFRRGRIMTAVAAVCLIILMITAFLGLTADSGSFFL